MPWLLLKSRLILASPLLDLPGIAIGDTQIIVGIGLHGNIVAFQSLPKAFNSFVGLAAIDKGQPQARESYGMLGLDSKHVAQLRNGVLHVGRLPGLGQGM